MNKNLVIILNTFFNDQSTPKPVPDAGFCYVPQDCYLLVNLAQRVDTSPQYLYSDGATSCIITIVIGQNASGETLVALAHLSKDTGFRMFFDLIATHFRGDIQVYAQGANPPIMLQNAFAEPDDARSNAFSLNQWLDKHTGIQTNESWYITKSQVALGTGNPLEENRDCLGVDLTTMQVNNQRFILTANQRDTTEGLQTLFSIFGSELDTPLPLCSVDQSFPKEQIRQLLAIAYQSDWLSILELSDEEILYYFSTTPQYEVAWFCTTLRQSAAYVKRHLHLIKQA